MQAFVWDERFVTGLKRVDEQHMHLVDLVNKVGDFLLESRGDEAELESVFGELATYAQEHFAEEEGLMASTHVDARHVDAHARHHRDFVTELSNMWARRQTLTEPAVMLHDYLTSWLTVHILGEDQVMARMIERIRHDVLPTEAFALERERHDNRLSALLDALHKLYHVLSVQNRELAASNESLELKVEARTRDLASLNQQLKLEQADLRRALAEIEATQQQLLQSEKMASLGRMVAGFAHEINTPVGVAIGAVSHADRVIERTEAMLSGDEVSADDLLAGLAELREGNRLAAGNLQRAAELVQRLRRSSIDQEVEGERAFVLDQLIDDVVLGLKGRLAERGVQLKVDCPASLLILGQPVLYEQMLGALLGNALQHAFPVGFIGPEIELQVKAADDGMLHLACIDNGMGMPADVVKHVFEPFFTTSRGRGSAGLGLYLCYNIVTSRLDGTVLCTSEAGHGTTFDVTIPIHRLEASA